MRLREQLKTGTAVPIRRGFFPVQAYFPPERERAKRIQKEGAHQGRVGGAKGLDFRPIVPHIINRHSDC